jgi:hypothetical protein
MTSPPTELPGLIARIGVTIRRTRFNGDVSIRVCAELFQDFLGCPNVYAHVSPLLPPTGMTRAGSLGEWALLWFRLGL